MALSATMRRFEISLADSDRGIYESLDLRAAQHPSETELYLVARVCAYCLELAEGIAFSKGLNASDEPALWRHDLRGDLLAWIEVGSPGVDRLHRASKKGAQVTIYAWKQCEKLAGEIAARPVHRASEIRLFEFSDGFLAAIAGDLERNNKWDLSVSGGEIYLSTGATTHQGRVRLVGIGSGAAR